MVISRLLKNAFRRHSERSEESLFDQNVKKREIPHCADSVRNDEFEVFQHAVRKQGSERELPSSGDCINGLERTFHFVHRNLTRADGGRMVLAER